jgi:hypothetical protein
MRAIHAAGPAVLAVLWAAIPGAPSAAAAPAFNPRVSVDASHTDNVQYGSGERTPDWYSHLGLELPVRGEGPRSSWSLAYSPSYYRYQDTESLDHTEHRLDFGARTTPGRASTFSVLGAYEKTQLQGTASSLAAPDLYLTTRTERDFYRAEVAFERQAGARWSWNSALRGDRSRYSTISGFEPGAGEAVPEGKSNYEAELGARFTLTKSAASGIEYRFQKYVPEETAEVGVHLLNATMDYRAGRDVTVRVRAGAFRREPSGEAAEQDTGRESGLQGGVEVERRARTLSLRFDAGYGPSSGGGLRGTSTDAIAGLSIGGGRERRFRWDAAARYARREPDLEGEATLSTVAGSASFEWLFGQKLGVRIGGEYVRQSGASLAAQNGSSATCTAGLTWYPRGPARADAGGAL